MTADWGTALYGALKSADAIRAQAKATRPFDVLMHLGDIYYSGTPKEVQARFIDVWPAEAGKVSRSLNSNHEMYSGGFGYFDLLLPKLQQKSSYFALRNTHWLLVGLDTAYVDHDMDAQQVSWLNLVIEQAQKRKVVLFSHQQPFSRLSDQGPKLQRALRHHLEGKRITAWYFGHEHECVIYDKLEKWNLFGRCLGNGGIPAPRNSEVKSAPIDTKKQTGIDGTAWKRLSGIADVPGCIVLDGPNMDMVRKKDQDKFNPHGFMTLEFAGDKLIEKVFLADGRLLYTETIG
jgi:hypothetical protein